jgi:hypothetical protein
LHYEITEGGYEDHTRDIAMMPCTDYSFVKPHVSKKTDEMIKSHIEAE